GGTGDGAVDPDHGPPSAAARVAQALHQEQVHRVPGMRRGQREHLAQVVAGTGGGGGDVGAEPRLVGGAHVVEDRVHGDPRLRVDALERLHHALDAGISAGIRFAERVGDDVEGDVHGGAGPRGGDHRDVVRVLRGPPVVAAGEDGAFIRVVVDLELPGAGGNAGVQRGAGVRDG